MATTLLGITGKKGSGKDTFAARLVSHHGFTRLGFADPLKALAVDLNPILDFDVIHEAQVRLTDYLDVMGWDGAKQLPVVRRYLQHLGVAVRDNIGLDAWINALANKAALIPGPVVVTDVRFANEARWVQSRGELVRVVRPGLKDDGDKHPSETELDAWIANHIVINDHTVTQLHNNADRLAEYLFAYARV